MTSTNSTTLVEDSPRLCEFLNNLQNYLIEENKEPSTKETKKHLKHLKKQFFHDLDILDKERFLNKNSLIGINNKLLVDLLLVIWGKCVSWKFVIQDYLSSLAEVIKKAEDHVLSQRNQKFLKYLSKHRQIKLYFYYRSETNKKLRCALDDDPLNLDFDQKNQYCHQFQFINGEWYHFKMKPFPCPLCDDFWFDPLTFQTDYHPCRTLKFFCNDCNKAFTPFEPNQRNCGCQKKYKISTAEGKQIKTLLKHQKRLLCFEDPANLKIHLLNEINREFVKPSVAKLLGSFPDQLQHLVASAELINKIQRANDKDFASFVQQKIIDFQIIIDQLYKQSFHCYLCCLIDGSNRSDYKDEDVKVISLFSCLKCKQVVCDDHESKNKGICVSCCFSESTSIVSLQTAFRALNRHNLYVKKSIKK